MGKYNNIIDFNKDIADAIRAKEGTSDLINPQDFPQRINDLPVGGGESGGGSAEGGEPPIIVCMTKEAFFKNMVGEIPEDVPQEVFAQVMKELIVVYPLIGYRRSSVGAPEGESYLYSTQSMSDDLYENRLTYQTLKSIAFNYSQLIVDRRDKKIAELWTQLSSNREEAIAYINQLYPEQITLEEFLA